MMQRRGFLRAVCGLPVAGIATFAIVAVQAVDRDIENDIMHGRGGFLVPPRIAVQLQAKLDTCAVLRGGDGYGRLVPDCIRDQLLSPGASDMSDGIDR